MSCILYGIENFYKNVTEIIKDKKITIIPKSNADKDFLFGDPCCNVKKHILIDGLKFEDYEIIDLNNFINFDKVDKDIGFIILRHVNTEQTNLYWQECYDCIRKYYHENYIIIIDDNSNYNYITEKELYKTTIIQSEFHSRAELLPYYYYIKNNFFPTAVILHDSVFINTYINFNIDKYKIIWNFPHYWDQPEDEIRLIKLLSNHEELLKLHSDKSKWDGCFGCITIIKYDYLKCIYNKYNISNLLSGVLNRYNRISLERVLGCLLSEYDCHKEPTLLNDIMTYSTYGISYDLYLRHKPNLPLIKIWTGR